MPYLSHIPTEELKQDLLETKADIAVCVKALTLGIKKYSGGGVEKRLKLNKEIQAIIEAELESRS